MLSPEKPAADSTLSPQREALTLAILAAVQFAAIVDFMIVMPLGPQLMAAFKLTPGQFGLIVSSYSFAAGFTGLIASSIMDRFSRRSAFITLYAGFLCGTLWCGLAPTYASLVAARILTGAFGGILGGMAMTIVGDVFPEHRRGQATGWLMSGFALASVAGVPLGLYFGTKFGWHVPFIALVIGGLPALFLAPYAMPPLTGHLGRKPAHPLQSLIENFSHADHLNAFVLMISLMASGFLVFPYLSTYLVANVGLTNEELPWIYVVGGGLSLFASPVIGRLADRFGKLRVFRVLAPLAGALLLAITHLPPVPVFVAVLTFGVLMVCNVGRMIAVTALVTGSIAPHRRGGFLSANSSVQHVASGMAAYIGGAMITQVDDGPLTGFGLVGWLAAGATVIAIALAGRIRTLESPAENPSAAALSLAAAAEATADSGETLIAAAEER